ncbi:unnamed protein product [Cylindrotheca closterium]|uniref:Uncharacterized protein n=1 Tax=Cylindrotheca closterium TaxID=2856 RepID=A0AAD2FDS9_9STRA|nr:unnamed protein product [Cylindrotheca closterium]
MLLFKVCLGNNDTEESKWPKNAMLTPPEEAVLLEPSRGADKASMKLFSKSNSLPGLQESFGPEDEDGESDSSSDVSSMSSEQEGDAKKTIEETTSHMNPKAAEYLNKRGNMTPLQEKINGLTTLPAGIYCAIFCLTGSWLSQTMIQETRQEAAIGSDFQGDGCISVSWLPNLHAMPPLTVIAGAMSMILHMPFSFIYHCIYAHKLSSTARIDHWSRRMDQCMLHVYSALLSYAFSGRLDFFLVNLVLNVDCIVKQWEKRIIPVRNQSRLVLSIMCFTLPILENGDYSYFGRLYATMAIAFAVFTTYPFGGWSHTVFHLIFWNVPPMMMTYIPTLPASQDQLQLAAQCAVWAGSS